MNFKKVIATVVLGALLGVPSVFAQKKPTTPPAHKPAVSKSSKPAAHVRKDGKPDMRFKENKHKGGPLRKDGKPDMRFKANKGTKTTKSTKTTKTMKTTKPMAKPVVKKPGH